MVTVATAAVMPPSSNHVKVTNPFFLTVRASIVTGEWLDLKHFEIELFFLMHSAFHKYIFFMFLKCDIIFLNNKKIIMGFVR